MQRMEFYKCYKIKDSFSFSNSTIRFFPSNDENDVLLLINLEFTLEASAESPLNSVPRLRTKGSGEGLPVKGVLFGGGVKFGLLPTSDGLLASNENTLRFFFLAASRASSKCTTNSLNSLERMYLR